MATLPSGAQVAIDRQRFDVHARQLERLTLFTKLADLPPDNNGTERAIRGPVVGRKNYYGSKSRRGTEVAATMYTLLETAKLNGVDPMSYLKAAVHASRRGEILLPWEMA